MKKEQVQQLKHGLYIIHWKSGGSSLAAVGSKYDGSRWICCCNWTSELGKPTDACGPTIWEKVDRVGLICK